MNLQNGKVHQKYQGCAVAKNGGIGKCTFRRNYLFNSLTSDLNVCFEQYPSLEILMFLWCKPADQLDFEFIASSKAKKANILNFSEVM